MKFFWKYFSTDETKFYQFVSSEIFSKLSSSLPRNLLACLRNDAGMSVTKYRSDPIPCSDAEIPFSLMNSSANFAHAVALSIIFSPEPSKYFSRVS